MPVLDTVLAPLEIVISHVLVAAHAGLTGAGLPAASGGTWAASIGVLVVAVRLALLPLAVRQIRSARRLAAVAPALAEVRARYRGRRDPDSLARMRVEVARVYAEAGASPLGWLPLLLLQAPVLVALFRVLDSVARGQAVGALGPALVAQLDGATLAGASLTQTVQAGGPAALVALALTGVMAGTLWLIQHRQLTRNTPPAALEGPAATTQRLLRWVVPATAFVWGLTAPIGLLVYFACTNLVSLGQQMVVLRASPLG
jgi:YidC/Oxa1 family membrane protein insertase